MQVGTTITINGRQWRCSRVDHDALTFRPALSPIILLALWRVGNKLTQQKAAKRLKIGTSTVCMMEKGIRPIPQRIIEIITKR